LNLIKTFAGIQSPIFGFAAGEVGSPIMQKYKYREIPAASASRIAVLIRTSSPILWPKIAYGFGWEF